MLEVSVSCFQIHVLKIFALFWTVDFQVVAAIVWTLVEDTLDTCRDSDLVSPVLWKLLKGLVLANSNPRVIYNTILYENNVAYIWENRRI